MFIRSYLRASTAEQDASRARQALEEFAATHGHKIAAEYMENASGAQADRPELLRLLRDARNGDVLLVESIDRLSRLPSDDWQRLKAAIDSKGLRIVALDLPTSHQGMAETAGDEFTGRMLGAINSMLVEMMAAIARKDYEQRRQRQAQGITKARAEGKYKGRPIDEDLHKRVAELLKAGLGIRATARHASCSTTTVLRIRDELEARHPVRKSESAGPESVQRDSAKGCWAIQSRAKRGQKWVTVVDGLKTEDEAHGRLLSMPPNPSNPTYQIVQL